MRKRISSLVEAAIQGEEVILDRSGKPVARIVPFHDSNKTRLPGGLEGFLVRILLDTSVLLNWIGNTGKITPRMRELIQSDRNLVAFSPLSIWECRIKQAKGRLVAQARIKDLTLLTHDRMISRYDVRSELL